MSPTAADVNDLAVQLADDGIAFGTDNPVNAALRRDLEAALKDVSPTAAGRTGVVVLEQTGQPPAQLRDLAQDVQAMTDLDTVIVRTPTSTAAVSDTLTRAQVEKGQFALIVEPDYADGVRAFGAQAESFAVPWGVIAGAVVFLSLLTVVVTIAAYRVSIKR